MRALAFVLALSFSTASAQTYWNTVHIANWDHGTTPATAIPWKSITHLIHFSGNSLGRQTNASALGYFEPPSNYEDAYSQQLHTLAKQFGVKLLVDLGFNQSNQFTNVCALGIPAMQTWASTVAHYIVRYGYDGADFDAEGGSYPTNGGMGKMAQLLHDTLAVLSPGKKFYITTSMMPNGGDVAGYGVAAGIAYFDQVNDMWYDQCFPTNAPLFPSSTHPCWGTDSSVAAAYERAGIPKSKIGLGYPIQVYDGCQKCYAYLNQVMQYFPGATVYWDDQAKERWFVGNGHTICYEDSLTGWWKADFVKRKGYGGLMGFNLTYGYISNPPPGWSHNPAIDGVGKALLGIASPPPIDTTHVPPPPPGTAPSILNYRLVTTSTCAPIAGYDPLKPDAVLSLRHLPAQFTIEAVTSPATLGSVSFSSPSAHIENFPPYHYPNDFVGGGCVQWVATPGKYAITAAPYMGSNATGLGGATLSIAVTVVADSSTAVPPLPSNLCQRQIDSAFIAGQQSKTCPPFPDTAAIRASGFARGRASIDTVQVRRNLLVQIPDTLKAKIPKPQP